MPERIWAYKYRDYRGLLNYEWFDCYQHDEAIPYIRADLVPAANNDAEALAILLYAEQHDMTVEEVKAEMESEEGLGDWDYYNAWKTGIEYAMKHQRAELQTPNSLRVSELPEDALQRIVTSVVAKENDPEYQALLNDLNEQARLNGMGAERELALMAKLDVMSKSHAELLQIVKKLPCEHFDNIDQAIMNAEIIQEAK